MIFSKKNKIGTSMNFLLRTARLFKFSSHCKILISLFLLSTFSISANEIAQKPIVVLITSYNNARWVNKNLTSVLKQNYDNYRIVYIDDCSKDGTADKAKFIVEKLKQTSRVEIISNEERKGALENIYEAVLKCADDEIVVSLDGDDWFPNTAVLKKINETYSSSEVWLTHGTLIEYPNQSTSWCIPIPKKIIANNLYRTYRCPSHLRTFYAWLFKKIDVNDLKFEGQFFPMTWDQAIMFPMIEMAAERHAFISDVVYVYNVANSINDNKVNACLQNDLEKLIRSMPTYQRLDKSPLISETSSDNF